MATCTCVLFSLFAAAVNSSGPEEHRVWVLPDLAYQAIEGFGQGNMDQSNVPWYKTLSEEQKKKLLDDLYTTQGDGLGLNICRTYIWGGDDPSHAHMWRGPGSQSCIGFEVRPGEFVWEGHEASLWHPRGAQERGATLVAFWNSAPYWMTRSGCSSGSVQRGENNLRDDRVDLFARHICQVIRHYEEVWGFDFKYVCPINEPEMSYWSTDSGQEGCNMDVEQARRVFKALHREIKSSGLDVLIQGPEAGASASTDYLDALLSDQDVREAIAVLTCHQYVANDLTLRRWGTKSSAAGKPLWMSEWGDWSSQGMDKAFNYARKIHQVHREMLSGTWCMWEPSFLFDQDEKGLHPRPAFYAVGHYSRFLPPGARVIEAVATNLNVTAYVDEREKQLIIVTFNEREEDVVALLDLSAFVGRGRMEVYRTSESERLTKQPEIRPRDDTAILLPRRSILTLVMRYEDQRPSLVVNAGFEKGTMDGWQTRGDAGIESTYPRGGGCNAFLHPSSAEGAAVSQIIQGLRKGKTYTLSAACATSGIPATLGVRVGDERFCVSAEGKGYALKTVTFKPGRDGQAEIFYECAPSSLTETEPPWAVLDNVFLR